MEFIQITSLLGNIIRRFFLGGGGEEEGYCLVGWLVCFVFFTFALDV